MPHLISPTVQDGVLLVGHGTRDVAGQREFFQVATQLARLVDDWAVEPCFLELAQPSIEQGLKRLRARELKQLVVAPLLLFAAGHAKSDIPQAVARALADQADWPVTHAGPLGCHPQILELSARRFREAVEPLPSVSADETLLLMVGRGSFDPTATAEMERFTALRGSASPVAAARACFYAMAQPRLSDVLPEIAALPYRRIVVQPHLLFQGDLLTTLASQVRAFAAQQSHQQWVLTGPLGPDPLVAAALTDHVRNVIKSTS